MELKLSSQSYTFLIQLNKSSLSEELLKYLPLKSQACLWGQEIYF